MAPDLVISLNGDQDAANVARIFPQASHRTLNLGGVRRRNIEAAVRADWSWIGRLTLTQIDTANQFYFSSLIRNHRTELVSLVAEMASLKPRRVLLHCDAGKDRSAMVSCIVGIVNGAGLVDVAEHFVTSAKRMTPNVEAVIAAAPQELVGKVRRIFHASPASLWASLSQPTKSPGSDVIVLCGLPGAGKSTLARDIERRFAGCLVIDNDDSAALLAARGLTSRQSFDEARAALPTRLSLVNQLVVTPIVVGAMPSARDWLALEAAALSLGRQLRVYELVLTPDEAARRVVRRQADGGQHVATHTSTTISEMAPTLADVYASVAPTRERIDALRPVADLVDAVWNEG
jgi:predicted ABC-type ATPase/predicted protein tyrosine phosphatase